MALHLLSKDQVFELDSVVILITHHTLNLNLVSIISISNGNEA